MEKATLTISLPRTMKEFIEERLREGRFSTPSEYVRSLIRDDQDMMGKGDVALLLRRGVSMARTPARNSRRRK
ncbi:MAG: type II toxin-antitoxin system ParD family antitoxin [Acidobacteriia bacterium]|nr:type II toxin-antitoxin system ParD family antitoxin [Terriglobia bacterium]